MKLVRVALALLFASCDGGNDADAGRDSGDPAIDGGMDAGMIEDPDAGPTDAGFDAGPPFDAGNDFRDFLFTLDGTVWNGLATRNEDGADIERAYEMQFVGGGEPMWGEIRNPYGPARRRIRRFILPNPSGCESASICTINTTISIPDSSWETPPELRGRRETWRIEIIDGPRRELAIRNESSGIEEFFSEGPWPEPASGLTAEVRLFNGGSGGVISDAFCTSGTGGLDQPTLWEFARGLSEETTLAYDVVAGAELGAWNDGGSNRFGVRDVDGFDIGTLGGSERTDQFYFTVRYTGVIEHPGGNFQMRERDDLLEDGLWVFINFNVGATSVDDLFLEVHNFAWLDETPNEPSEDLFAGDVAIEIILVRCMMPFEDDVQVEMRLGGDGTYSLLSAYPSRPEIDSALFPPVL